MSRVSIKIVLDADHLARQGDVCARIRSLGVTIEEVIPEIGAIFGSAEEDAMERIRAVEGVQQAGSEAGYHLPPIGSDQPQ